MAPPEPVPGDCRLPSLRARTTTYRRDFNARRAAALPEPPRPKRAPAPDVELRRLLAPTAPVHRNCSATRRHNSQKGALIHLHCVALQPTTARQCTQTWTCTDDSSSLTSIRTHGHLPEPPLSLSHSSPAPEAVALAQHRLWLRTAPPLPRRIAVTLAPPTVRHCPLLCRHTAHRPRLLHSARACHCGRARRPPSMVSDLTVACKAAPGLWHYNGYAAAQFEFFPFVTVTCTVFDSFAAGELQSKSLITF